MKAKNKNRVHTHVHTHDEVLLEPVARFFRFNEGIKVLRNENPIKILDLGCGSDIRFYHFLIKKGVMIKHYTGIDYLLSEINIKKNTTSVVRLIKQPMLKKIPLQENNQFDYVVGFAFLEHCDYPKELLIDSIRVLKKDGLGIFTSPTKRARNLLEFLSFKLGIISKREIAEHKIYFDKEALTSMLYGSKVEISHKYFELGLNNLLVVKKL